MFEDSTNVHKGLGIWGLGLRDELRNGCGRGWAPRHGSL